MARSPGFGSDGWYYHRLIRVAFARVYLPCTHHHLAAIIQKFSYLFRLYLQLKEILGNLIVYHDFMEYLSADVLPIYISLFFRISRYRVEKKE